MHGAKHSLRHVLSADGSVSKFLVQSLIGAIGIPLAWQLFIGLPQPLPYFMLALAIFGAMLWAAYRWARGSLARVAISEDRRISARRGLVVLISPHEDGSHNGAVRHHHEAVEHCWLVSSIESLPAAERLAQQLTGPGAPPQLAPGRCRLGVKYLVDPDAADSCYEVIARILREEVPASGLDRAQVVVDITGGTKPMSIGAAYACLVADVEMQYDVPARDAQGAPIKASAMVPVRLETEFLTSAASLRRDKAV